MLFRYEIIAPVCIVNVYPHASEGESQRNQETLSKRNLYGFNGVPSQYRLTKRISHNNNSMELQTGE